MLILKIDKTEVWDPTNRVFINIKPTTLKLEHSLVSIRKWESITCKPFLHTKLETNELKLYVKCMTINQNVDENVYDVMGVKEFKEILEYMQRPMSAAKYKNRNSKKTNELVTYETIYYWMAIYNIPFECEKWNFKQLMSVITMCMMKEQPGKKMSKGDIYSQYREINARNRAKYHTKG